MIFANKAPPILEAGLELAALYEAVNQAAGHAALLNCSVDGEKRWHLLLQKRYVAEHRSPDMCARRVRHPWSMEPGLALGWGRVSGRRAPTPDRNYAAARGSRRDAYPVSAILGVVWCTMA